MSEKYARIIKFCDKEIDKTLKVFKKQKHRPPLGINFPPLSGNIKCCTVTGKCNYESKIFYNIE